MKYHIGQMVYITSEKWVYITDYDEETKKYMGYEVKDNIMGLKKIKFKESSVLVSA